MEKEFIELKLTKEELSVVFNCLIGTFSCPPSQSYLVNKVYALCREHNIINPKVYCSIK